MLLSNRIFIIMVVFNGIIEISNKNCLNQLLDHCYPFGVDKAFRSEEDNQMRGSSAINTKYKISCLAQ